ncbi:hypothetical protein Fmac_028953 [Flemingia macrophylla]|uniref:WRKY domain-containing protein n=1 Tax=Flemingia macrophylla TaxID=520843 RepID=A0ABD1L8Z6_9FABA
MDHRKICQELVRGREVANRLRQVMNEHDESSSFVQTLAKNVLRSFSNSLFLLDKYPTYEPYDVSQMQQKDSCFIISSTKSEDSQESCKSFTRKNRRGCYKRKRTTQEWEEVSETPIVDGNQWRKYGQKKILEAKYSRSYYRCSHKNDQNCQASKQVQRIQEEPPLYKTTYFGHHTCNNDLLNSEIILDSNSSPAETSILLSFNNTFPNPTKQECPFLSSFHPSPSSDCYMHPPELEATLDDSSRNNNNDVTLSPRQWDDISTLLDSADLDDAFHHFGGF